MDLGHLSCLTHKGNNRIILFLIFKTLLFKYGRWPSFIKTQVYGFPDTYPRTAFYDKTDWFRHFERVRMSFLARINDDLWSVSRKMNSSLRIRDQPWTNQIRPRSWHPGNDICTLYSENLNNMFESGILNPTVEVQPGLGPGNIF